MLHALQVPCHWEIRVGTQLVHIREVNTQCQCRWYARTRISHVFSPVIPTISVTLINAKKSSLLLVLAMSTHRVLMTTLGINIQPHISALQTFPGPLLD